MLDWIAPMTGTPIEAWRRRILASVLFALVAFGLLAYVPSVYVAWQAGETGVIVIDTVMYAFMTGILLARNLAYRWRAIAVVLIPAILGVFFLAGFGFFAAGFEWVMIVPILAAVLLGLRTGLLALGAIALTLLVIGLAIPTGNLPWSNSMPGFMPPAHIMWVVNSVSVLMLAALATVAVGVLFDGLGDEASARRVAEVEALRLAAAVEQSDGLVALYAADGTLRFANQSARELLGPNAPEALRGLWPQVLGGTPWAGNLELPRAEGRPRPLSGSLSPVRAADGTVEHVLATLRDITRERALEQRLQQGQKLEAIGTLAGGIAHDFNNLLQPIVLNTEAVQASLPADASAQPLLDDVRHAADRARALVRRILTFTRAMEHERRPVSMAELLAETERLLRLTLPRTIQLATRADPTAIVYAEPAELQQVLLNLATNAVQAMPQGGRLDMTVSVEAAPTSGEWRDAFAGLGQVVHVTVRDTGLGMDMDTLQRAFDPFFTTKAPGRGTGLGLAMVHGTVTSLGGVVQPESAPGRGTTMRIVLPLAAPATPSDIVTPTPPRAPGHRRVLVVDDEAAVLHATARLLERHGWQVEAVTSAEDALDHLRAAATHFDCLLTDLSMPGLSGLELAEAARTLHPALPVVLATGYLDTDAAIGPDAGRVSAVLTKPFTSEALRRTLDQVVTA